jgi:nucleoid DNA-binding protein
VTKQQLIEQVAVATGQSKSDVERVYEAIIEKVSARLAAGEKVEMRGLGVFEAKETKERTGRHPKTGGVLVIPAGRRVNFRIGKELKEHVSALRSEALASGAGA